MQYGLQNVSCHVLVAFHCRPVSGADFTFLPTHLTTVRRVSEEERSPASWDLEAVRGKHRPEVSPEPL